MPNKKHHIKFGAEYTFHVFIPSAISAQEPNVNFSTNDVVHLYSQEAGIYATDEWAVTDLFKVEYGLRYSFYEQVGPFTRYNENSQGQFTDTIKYKTLKNVVNYGGLEPRISMKYTFG